MGNSLHAVKRAGVCGYFCFAFFFLFILHFFVCFAIVNACFVQSDSVLPRELQVCLSQSDKLKYANVNSQKVIS